MAGSDAAAGPRRRADEAAPQSSAKPAKRTRKNDEDMKTEDGGDSDSDDGSLDERMNISEDEDSDEGGRGDKAPRQGKVYRHGVDELAEDEELDFDPSAYEMLHRFATEWPCLTFDIVKDGKGVGRKEYPLDIQLVAGSQAEKPEDNRLYVMKW